MAIYQRLITAVVRQFGHPRGIGGHLAGWVMPYRGRQDPWRRTRRRSRSARSPTSRSERAARPYRPSTRTNPDIHAQSLLQRG